MNNDPLDTKELEGFFQPEPAEETKVERINGQDIRVGTLAEFADEVLGMAVAEALKPPLMMILGIEKFKTHAHRWYRLIWIGKRTSWLAAEDPERFELHRDAVAAGRTLAQEHGAYFDEVSR